MTVTIDVVEFAPNCDKCHGICCVALAFNWPHYKKPAGLPCKNLDENNRCRKWDTLEGDGYVDCRTFNCRGAGQAVAQYVEETDIPNWRDSPEGEHAEIGLFQQVYTELYKEFNHKPPAMKPIPDEES